jgi:hypothetical protein
VIRDGQKKFWILILIWKMYFPKPCQHGKKLFVRTSMGGSVSPNPPLLSKLIWEVDSWNGGDLNLESNILAGRWL